MTVTDLQDRRFRVGDLVIVRSLDDKTHFCIIGFKRNPNGERLAILKGLFNQTCIVERPIGDLQSLLLRGRL
jgi:hypothetical protein